MREASRVQDGAGRCAVQDRTEARLSARRGPLPAAVGVRREPWRARSVPALFGYGGRAEPEGAQGCLGAPSGDLGDRRPRVEAGTPSCAASPAARRGCDVKGQSRSVPASLL